MRLIIFLNLAIILSLLFMSCGNRNHTNSENNINQSNQKEDKLYAEFYLDLNKDKSTIKAYFERSQSNYVQVSNLKMNDKSFQFINSRDECYSTDICYEIIFDGIEKNYNFSFTDEQKKNHKITYKIDPIYFQLGTMTYSRSKNPPLLLSRKLTEKDAPFEAVKFDENPSGLTKGLSDTTADKSGLLIPDSIAKEMWVGEGRIEFHSSQKEYFYEDAEVKSKLECVSILKLNITR